MNILINKPTAREIKVDKIKGKDLELRARRKGKDLGWIKASEIIEFIVKELPLCEEETKRNLLYKKYQQIQQLQEENEELRRGFKVCPKCNGLMCILVGEGTKTFICACGYKEQTNSEGEDENT